MPLHGEMNLRSSTRLNIIFSAKLSSANPNKDSATFPLPLDTFEGVPPPNYFRPLQLFSATFEKSSGVFRYLATVTQLTSEYCIQYTYSYVNSWIIKIKSWIVNIMLKMYKRSLTRGWSFIYMKWSQDTMMSDTLHQTLFPFSCYLSGFFDFLLRLQKLTHPTWVWILPY